MGVKKDARINYVLHAFYSPIVDTIPLSRSLFFVATSAANTLPINPPPNADTTSARTSHIQIQHPQLDQI